MVISSFELCAGVGMLGEGVRAAFEFLGWQHRTVAYVEREAPAAAQLVALMEAECLDAAPVYSDLLTFNGRAWRRKVDCVIAGFPCQDLSVAGKRAGLGGKRSGLFFNVLDIADDCGAWLLILENVTGITSATASVMDEEEGELDERAVSRVLGELADRGWDAECLTLSASDVGASQERKRWFCLAWRQLANTESERGRQWFGDEQQGRAEAKSPDDDLGDSECTRWPQTGSRSEVNARSEPGSGCCEMGHSGLQYQHLQQRADGAEHQAAGCQLAHTHNRTRPRREVGSEPPHAEPVISNNAVANTSQPGCEGSEQRGTRIGNGGGAESIWIN